MIIAIVSIIALVILLIEDFEFWPPLMSWFLMPFVVIYGLWWSRGLAVFPFSDIVEDGAIYFVLWDATILTAAFFGSVLGWLSLKVLRQKDDEGKTKSDRLGELLIASKYSSRNKP